MEVSKKSPILFKELLGKESVFLKNVYVRKVNHSPVEWHTVQSIGAAHVGLDGLRNLDAEGGGCMGKELCGCE